MFTFKRNSNEVVLEVDSKLPIKNSIYLFRWHAPDENWAQLLKDRLLEVFHNVIENIRRTEYERGWKDAKAHNKKETWFKGWID